MSYADQCRIDSIRRAVRRQRLLDTPRTTVFSEGQVEEVVIRDGIPSVQPAFDAEGKPVLSRSKGTEGDTRRDELAAEREGFEYRLKRVVERRKAS